MHTIGLISQGYPWSTFKKHNDPGFQVHLDMQPMRLKITKLCPIAPMPQGFDFIYIYVMHITMINIVH